jgi:hypothetical protein
MPAACSVLLSTMPAERALPQIVAAAARCRTGGPTARGSHAAVTRQRPSSRPARRPLTRKEPARPAAACPAPQHRKATGLRGRAVITSFAAGRARKSSGAGQPDSESGSRQPGFVVQCSAGQNSVVQPEPLMAQSRPSLSSAGEGLEPNSPGGRETRKFPSLSDRLGPSLCRLWRPVHAASGARVRLQSGSCDRNAGQCDCGRGLNVPGEPEQHCSSRRRRLRSAPALTRPGGLSAFVKFCRRWRCRGCSASCPAQAWTTA